MEPKQQRLSLEKETHLPTGLSILDVAIGLVVVYLVLSLICSSINEGIETFLKNRSRQLERGIREILADPDGTKVTQLVYNHPLISGLFQGHYDPAHLKQRRFPRGKYYGKTNLPSYIPASNFALAILDILLPSTAAGPGGAAAALNRSVDHPDTLGVSLRAAAMDFPVPAVGRAVALLVDACAYDVVLVRTSIEAWYNSTMDRVSGWYKRRTQMILFSVALIMAAALNVDTIDIANHLAADPALRNSLVSTAQEYARSDIMRNERPAPAPGGETAGQQVSARIDRVQQNISRLESLGVPIGWGHHPEDPYRWFLKVAGILASALAAALGAPFWFDILNRFVVIRSTIKPKEKSPEEKSKD
jgi:hypothetical protein